MRHSPNTRRTASFRTCFLHSELCTIHHFAAELQKTEAEFLILVAMPLHSIFCISVLYNPYSILYTAEPKSNSRLEIEGGEDALVQLVALQRRSPINCLQSALQWHS